jgi:hypothetical protein
VVRFNAAGVDYGFRAVPIPSLGADAAKNEAQMQAAVRTADRVERGLGMGCA